METSMKTDKTEKEELQNIFEAYILKERRRKNRARLCRDLVITAGVVFILFSIIAGLAVVRGDSMKPNITNGSVIIFYRLDHTYKRNDIVIFQAPGSSDILIKRIAAVAGDKVDIDNKKGVLLVNGVVQQSGSVLGKTYTRGSGVTFPLTVPNDCIFVLGDNRETALDSRNIGTIHVKKLIGKVFFEIKSLIS